jgi:hypothetical protein
MLARAFVDRAHRLEELPSRSLGAVVGVVMRRLCEQDVEDLPIAAQFLQKHQSNIDVFRIPASHWCVGNHQRTLVVQVELKAVGELNSQLTKELARPKCELACCHHRQKFCLARAQRHAVLELGLVGDEVAEEEEAVPCSRATRVRIASVVSVAVAEVGAEITIAAGEEPLRVLVGVHVVEDPYQVVPVFFARIRHVLAAHANGEGDLREGPVGDVGHRTKALTEVLRPPECRRIAFCASPQLTVGSCGCDLAFWRIPREACKES